jgi:NAD(P)-dependent dehydrogenase (short-subunit alcohol dehydrogenase family)
VIPIDLSEKTIVMTGALGGIAEGIVPRLLEAGARLILPDVVPAAEAQERLARWSQYADQITYRELDITGREVDRVIDGIFDDFPAVNVALAHAGGCVLHPFATTSPDDFEQVIDFNLVGQTRFARAVLRQWTQRGTAGHLVFTSSWVARIPWTGIPAYCTAKAGIEMFARCLALEYARQQIRVNCVAPGNVAAGASKHIYETDAEYRETVDRISPLGWRNSAESIGNALLFLCSDLANEMDGQVLQVDAGVGLPKLV